MKEGARTAPITDDADERVTRLLLPQARWQRDHGRSDRAGSSCAARLWGMAALRKRMGVPPPPTTRDLHQRWMAHARTTRDDRRFARAWGAGHATTLEQAVADAREDDPTAACGGRQRAGQGRSNGVHLRHAATSSPLTTLTPQRGRPQPGSRPGLARTSVAVRAPPTHTLTSMPLRPGGWRASLLAGRAPGRVPPPPTGSAPPACSRCC